MQHKNQPVIARSNATKQSIQNHKNCYFRMFLSGIYNACNDAQGGDPRQRHSGMTSNFGDDANKYAGMTTNLYPLTCPSGHPLPQGARRTTHDGFTARSVTPQGRYAGYSGHIGFTFIELLVVVLIIGILAAVAVAQYQLAVNKTRYMAILPLMRAINQAQKVYFLANGTYAKKFSELDVNLPAGVTTTEIKVTYKGYSCWLNTNVDSVKCQVDGFPEVEKYYSWNSWRCFHGKDATYRKICSTIPGSVCNAQTYCDIPM